MQRRQRVVVRCAVQFDRLGRSVIAESEDLSARGVFVRTEELLPVGEVVELTIVLPGRVVFRVVARVAHLLAPSAARALGRHVGMGFEFLEHDNVGREDLERYLDELIEDLTPMPQELPGPVRVLLADSSAKLRERLYNALTAHGFEVTRVENGAAAFQACSESPPDIVVAAAEMPVMDGWALLKTLSSTPYLNDVPVVLTSEDGSDMTRLQAYRLGVRDFVHKPFIEDEIVIRLHHIAMSRRDSRGVMLRGNLAEISIPTLLSLFEFERKSGILVVLQDAAAARLFVADGRVVRVEGPTDENTAFARVLALLDWSEGNFEFTSCEVVGRDELGIETSRLLLEHARRQDEGHR